MVSSFRTNAISRGNVTQSLAVFFLAINPFILSRPTKVEAGVVKNWNHYVHLSNHLSFQVGFWLWLRLLNSSPFYLAPFQHFPQQGSTDQYSTPGTGHCKPSCRSPLSTLVSETKYLYVQRRFSVVLQRKFDKMFQERANKSYHDWASKSKSPVSL